MKLFRKENKTDGSDPLGLYDKNKTSCLTTAFFKILACVCACLWSCVLSCLVGHPRHMPGCTTRKCKETLLQVRERLTREQTNRTSKRIRELLDTKDLSSDSDSEEEQDSSSEVSSDTLSLLRRDLYLALLCLLLLIVLLTYWVRITTLRN
jgi:hypothetical protein